MSSRNPDYQFIVTDAGILTDDLEKLFEQIVGHALHAADPETLIARWGAAAYVQLCALINYAANQNIPSRAEGTNLDALGELFYLHERPGDKYSHCTMRFTISQAQPGAILIPGGTRVSNDEKTIAWATEDDYYIPAGETTAELPVYCQTAGASSNGYAPGAIKTCVDIFDYYLKCENITETDGGADAATDDEFYELLRASEDAWSTAGPKGAYEYHAMQVSTEIQDVVANTPQPGHVALYVLMKDGKLAGEEIKNAVLAACSAEDVRPLTDFVEVADPEEVEYDIDITYYIPNDSTKSSAEIQNAVEVAVESFTQWQYANFGRDINPSKLIAMLMETGIKRVEVASPEFTKVNDGSDGQKPQVAKCKTRSIKSGGRESE